MGLNRRYSSSKQRHVDAGNKEPELQSGPNVGRQEFSETTGPFKPIEESGSKSGFNRGVNFPELKAYVKKSGI